MRDMWKTVYTGIVIGLLSLALCACTTYQFYAGNLFAGKESFEKNRYQEAQRYFEDAARHNVDGAALTYLAVIAYKENKFDTAQRFIANAEKAPPDMLSSLRMYGYKALISLAVNQTEGMGALKEYIDRYDNLYPLESIADVKDMWRSGRVDRAGLETIIDEQIKWYEQDMELYIYSNVGFYARQSSDGAL